MLTYTSSGTRILMILRMARSSASMSISLLCMRISHLSHVAVPSPHGVFLTGTLRRFVGKGMGPVIFTPVFSAMVLSSVHTSSSFWKSVLVSLILAFLTMRCCFSVVMLLIHLAYVLNTFPFNVPV